MPFCFRSCSCESSVELVGQFSWDFFFRGKNGVSGRFVIFFDVSDCFVEALSGLWSDVSTVSTERCVGSPTRSFEAPEVVGLTCFLLSNVAFSFEGRRVKFAPCFGKVIAINGMGFPFSVSSTTCCFTCLAGVLSASYVNLTVTATFWGCCSCS